APFGLTSFLELDDHLRETSNHHSILSSFARGDVIEIQGGPASGKTHLLYHLVSVCILPTAYGGWNKAAILYDTDQGFDVRRLQQILITRVSTHMLRAHQEGVDTASIVSGAMRNLRVFPVESASQLSASLQELPAYHGEELTTSEIAILAIDSLSAFYWEDRFAMESTRPRYSWSTRAFIDPNDLTERARHPLHAILVAIQAMRLSHGPIIVLTNWGLQPAPGHSTSPTTPLYRQHLPF
ncbi:hypothetical protein K488DRAFT_22691, partial [Vararia minispora EC-137]